MEDVQYFSLAIEHGSAESDQVIKPGKIRPGAEPGMSASVLPRSGMRKTVAGIVERSPDSCRDSNTRHRRSRSGRLGCSGRGGRSIRHRSRRQPAADHAKSDRVSGFAGRVTGLAGSTCPRDLVAGFERGVNSSPFSKVLHVVYTYIVRFFPPIQATSEWRRQQKPLEIQGFRKA